MKVLLVNGSPHAYGCVYTSLTEIAETLKTEDVDSEIFWIGNRAVQGCIACFECRNGHEHCVFQDDLYLNFTSKMKEADAIIIGAPDIMRDLREVCVRFLTGFAFLPENISNANRQPVW